MSFLFLFLDGVGLGSDDPNRNPFARVKMPFLTALLGGKRLLRSSLPEQGFLEAEGASLLGLDATLGVPGLPQSATGQACLLTGRNVPAEIGYHYGPKPNQLVAPYLRDGTLFRQIRDAGLQAEFVNAYPPGYFEAIASGRRLFSAIPLAVSSAGLTLKTAQDLRNGRALSADFTGRGWRERLDFPEIPVLSPKEAGARLAALCQAADFAFFEYWLSDYAGHRQDMQTAVSLLEELDQVLEGLCKNWQGDPGLILLTSDHGNLEDLSTRRHTTNPVPALLVDAPIRSQPSFARTRFAKNLKDLSDIAPAILDFFRASDTGNP